MTGPDTIGARIKRLREARGLSQAALGEAVGLAADQAQPKISKWERGTYVPSPEHLPALARVLDTSVDDLLGVEAPVGEAGPMPSIPFHPYADLFPLITGPAFEALVADMREHGFRAGEEIVLHEGQVLDGRNRLRAALAAGVIPADVSLTNPRDVGQHGMVLPRHFREFGSEGEDTADPLGFVIARNLHRRHLTASQRALIASEMARLPAHRPAKTEDGSPPIGGVPTDVAARLMNAGHRSVERARDVTDGAPRELVEAIRSGDITVGAAETIRALPAETQRRILDAVDPKVRRAAIKDARAEAQDAKRERRATREQDLAAKILDLPGRRYGVIYADPEWRFEPWSRESGMDRAADNHYPTSPVAAIEERMRAQCERLAAPDCALFLWATAPMLPAALGVMEACGFAYVTQIVWRKAELRDEAGAVANPAKADRGGYSAGLVLGTGYWFRNAHELLLLGTRGKVVAPAPGEQFPSVIDAPPSRHSQKPERYATMIEAYFPTVPKIELNARAARPGWTCVIHDPVAGSMVVDEAGEVFTVLDLAREAAE